MKPGLVILATLLTIVAGPHASAAQLSAVDDPRCDHLLSGDIEKNDTALFQNVSVSRLCLTSNGGSFVGGKALEDLFMTEGIQTFVRRGDACHSACGLAFLGGSQWGDMRHASRTLEPGGVLGFHAPYLALPPGSHDADEVSRLASVSMTIAGQIVAEQSSLKISSVFLTEFLLFPERQTREVRTVREAILGGIEIDTGFKLQTIGASEARNACASLFARFADAFADGVTATEPNFLVAPEGEFSRPTSGVVDIADGTWIMAGTSNSAETPWQTAACAFSQDTDHWGRRGALLWSNEPGTEPNLATSLRKVRLDVPAWYFLPAERLLVDL